MTNTATKHNIFAMIPARGGSKRLKGKNIFPLKGKPLLQYTVDAALHSKYLNKENIFVSTENAEIKNVALKFAKVIDRPEELAGDKVWTQDVINHFVETLNLQDEDIVVILQANSPQISSVVIDKCIDMLIENNLWQVHTVDPELINNGAVQVMRVKVSHHKGKANYNGVVITDIIDVHTIEDVEAVIQQMNL